MASTPPLDDWESVDNEEHLDVKELKSQIYDLKQKLTLADAQKSTLLKDKKDIQSVLDVTKKKVSALEEMNNKQKRDLMLLKTDKKNEALLEEEIEKSGQMKVEIMQMKQTIKEKESLEGMLNAKTKELDQAKKQLTKYCATINEISELAVPSTSSLGNKSSVRLIQQATLRLLEEIK